MTSLQKIYYNGIITYCAIQALMELKKPLVNIFIGQKWEIK
jgi:hypothetical protein